MQLTGWIGTSALPSALIAMAPSSWHQALDAKVAVIVAVTGTGAAGLRGVLDVECAHRRIGLDLAGGKQARARNKQRKAAEARTGA